MSDLADFWGRWRSIAYRRGDFLARATVTKSHPCLTSDTWPHSGRPSPTRCRARFPAIGLPRIDPESGQVFTEDDREPYEPPQRSGCSIDLVVAALVALILAALHHP